LAHNLVVKVQLQLAVFDQMLEKCGQVSRVHLAGVIRHAGRPVEIADDGYAMFNRDFARLREFAVPAALAGEVHDHRTWRHTRDHFLYDIHDPKLAANKFGVVEADKTGKVVSLEEKPAEPKTSLIGMGVYYFPASSLPKVGEYLADKN